MVGCLAGGNITAASFVEVNIFVFIDVFESSSIALPFLSGQVNVMMDTEAEAINYCRPFLLSRQRDCLADAKGPGFTIVEATNPRLTSKASIPRDCSLACSKQASCKAWIWEANSGRCQLFTGGKLSGYLAGKTSFAGTCL